MTVVVIGDNTGDDFSGTIDAQIKEGASTTNYGSSSTMETTKWSAGDYTHSVIAFTGLSNITGPVTVNDAKVSLRLTDELNLITQTISMYRLLRNWVEGEVTWDDYSTSNAWQTAGGTGANDRSGTVSATASIGSGPALQYYDFTGTQIDTDVENMINGSVSNYGWHDERTDGGAGGYYLTWATSEGTDGQRPYLTVDYTASATDPEGTLIGGKLLRGGLLMRGVLVS